MTQEVRRMWVVREGAEPLPHIGPGPLDEAAFAAAEATYLQAHYGEGVEVPADATRPRDTGGYVLADVTVDVPDSPPAATTPRVPGPRRAARTEPVSAEEAN